MDDVAGLALCGVAGFYDDGAAHGFVVEFAAVGGAGADRADECGWFEPLAEEDWLGRTGDGDDDIGGGDSLLGSGGVGAYFVGEGLGVVGVAGPDADIRELADVGEGGEVGAGLNSAAEDGEDAGLRSSEQVGCYGGDGSGAHFGDEASVHGGEGFAGGGAEELNDGVVGVFMESGVAGVESDELCAHHVSVDGGHGCEPARVGGDGEDHANGLDGAAGGEVCERGADGGDEVAVGEDGADLVFVKEQSVGGHENASLCSARMGGIQLEG